MGDVGRRVAGVGALALLAVPGLGMAGGAVSDPVLVTAPGAVAVPLGSRTAVPGGAVGGFAATEPVRLVVSVGSGFLSFPDPVAGLTVPFGFPAFGVAGPEVAVEGVEDAVNAALSELHWTPTERGPTSLTLDASPAGAVYGPDNGHYYQLVTSPGAVTWDEARAAAEASSFNGFAGYLATITTPAEQDLLTRTTPDPAWIGASDTAGSWQWTSGPEAGTPLSYTMWEASQPDGILSHDVAVFDGFGGAGLWHATAADDPTVTRYLVEYGGGPGETATQEGHASTTLAAIVPPGAPAGVQVEPAADAVTVSWQPPADDGGAPPSAYVVTGTPSGSCLVAAPTLACAVGGLDAQTTYRFRVAAVNDAGQGLWSDESAPIALASQNPGATPTETAPPPSTTTAPTLPPTAPPLAVEPTLPPPDSTTPPSAVEPTGPPSATTTPPTATLVSPTTVATTSRVTTATTTTTTSPPTPRVLPTIEAPSMIAASPAGHAAVYVVFDVGVGTELPDARLTVRGTGLRPGSSVTITAHSTPVLLDVATASLTGTVTWDGRLPADLGDGDHTIDVLATGTDGNAVGRASSFAVSGGVLSRIGAAVAGPAPKPAPVAGTATTTGRTASAATTPAEGGGSGGSVPWLPLLAITAATGAAGALWRRRQRAGSNGRPPTAADALTRHDAPPARSRTTPRRRARPRRRASRAHPAAPR
jgi:hypothetical protein